ncbi:hypothetical protein LINGRAHAP2_LOCUS23075 [Linum grandiflorum]
MDDCLINVMLDLAKNNQYQNGSFRPGTYHEMEKQLLLLDPGCGVKVNPNIVSRVKTLKRKFNRVKELRALSGAGWNDALKQVELDPIIYIPIPRYDELAMIFSNSSATGKGARGINDPVPIEDDIFDIEKEVGDEGSVHYEVDATTEAGEEFERRFKDQKMHKRRTKAILQFPSDREVKGVVLMRLRLNQRVLEMSYLMD